METIEQQIDAAIQLLKNNDYQVRKRPNSTYDYNVKIEDIEHEWIQSIIRDVSFCNHIEIDDLIAKTRKREVVESRQIAQCIAHKMKNDIGISLASIGYRIGNQDHATVLHSSKTVLNLIQTDKGYRKKYESIIRMYKLDE